MLALWAVSTSLFSWETAFAPIESSGCCTSLAAVILPLATVSWTCTGPYWVSSLGPVKLPDGFAGAVLGGAFGGAELDGAVAGCVAAGVVLAGVAGRVVGVADALAVFFADADGVALAEPAADTAGDADADTDSPVGVLGSATGVTPGTWVLNENSAARPATVPLRVRTARRIQPPGGVAPGEQPLPVAGSEVEGLMVDAAPGDARGDQRVDRGRGHAGRPAHVRLVPVQPGDGPLQVISVERVVAELFARADEVVQRGLPVVGDRVKFPAEHHVTGVTGPVEER